MQHDRPDDVSDRLAVIRQRMADQREHERDRRVWLAANAPETNGHPFDPERWTVRGRPLTREELHLCRGVTRWCHRSAANVIRAEHLTHGHDLDAA